MTILNQKNVGQFLYLSVIESFSVKSTPVCKVSPLVWSIFIGQNADLTSGRDCTGKIVAVPPWNCLRDPRPPLIINGLDWLDAIKIWKVTGNHHHHPRSTNIWQRSPRNPRPPFDFSALFVLNSGGNCIKIDLPGKLILSKRKGLQEVLRGDS